MINGTNMKVGTIAASVPASFVKTFDETVSRMGLTPSSAIRLFAAWTVTNGKLPFEATDDQKFRANRRGALEHMDSLIESGALIDSVPEVKETPAVKPLNRRERVKRLAVLIEATDFADVLNHEVIAIGDVRLTSIEARVHTAEAIARHIAQQASIERIAGFTQHQFSADFILALQALGFVDLARAFTRIAGDAAYVFGQALYARVTMAD